jgi:hypothetical protein
LTGKQKESKKKAKRKEKKGKESAVGGVLFVFYV